MLIDCDSCAVRGAACSGCAANALFDAPGDISSGVPVRQPQLTVAERRAVGLFRQAGFDVQVLAPPPVPRRIASVVRR